MRTFAYARTQFPTPTHTHTHAHTQLHTHNYTTHFQIKNQLHSFVGPVIFVGVLAYLVASVYAEMFSMATATLLQCFVADEEMYAPHERYAQNELREWVDVNGAKTQAKAGPVAAGGGGGGGAQQSAVVAVSGTR
jgi:Plasma-membrane choline transporter